MNFTHNDEDNMLWGGILTCRRRQHNSGHPPRDVFGTFPYSAHMVYSEHARLIEQTLYNISVWDQHCPVASRSMQVGHMTLKTGQ